MTEPSIEIIKENGSITVSGICVQPIARLRLFTPVKFQIVKNVVEDELEIKINSDGSVTEIQIVVYDVYGQKATTPSLRATPSYTKGNIRIDVSGFAAGLYFVRIGDMVEKFVKL